MTKRRESVAQIWESYRKEVLPPDAGPIQVSECRRAFYAGAHGLMTAVMLALDPEAEPTADDVEYMGQLQIELDTFAHAVVTGRA